MINYTATPTNTTAHTFVHDDHSRGFSIEAVEMPPDHAALLDTVEDEIRESLINGETIPDIATRIIAHSRRELLSELLVKLLVVLADSDNLKLDVEILISAAGLPLRDESDSSIAQKFGILRQTFSARKKSLMKKLGLNPPPHSKSESACREYSLGNRRNGNIN